MSEKVLNTERQLAAAVGRIAGFVGLFLCFAGNAAFATDVTLTTKLDTNQILIGDHFKLFLEALRDEKTVITWPSLEGVIKIDNGLEIEILDSELDSTRHSSGMIKEIKTYTLTAFDSGYYAIPPISVEYKISGGDLQTVLSEGMSFTVKTVEVDTTKTFRPIKDPLKLPFQLKEIWRELAIGGGVLLAILAVVLYFSLRKKKPVIVKRYIRKDPPHETALNKLRELDEKKLWQHGEVKAYYSTLSDIIREYLEGRYEFPALESTTDEIMDRITVRGISNKMREDLRIMLQTADLVKFAKAMPLPDEHKHFMDIGVELVNTTKSEDKGQNIEVREEQK